MPLVSIDVIKNQFKAYEEAVVAELELEELDRKDHLYFKPPEGTTQHWKHEFNIISTLKPAQFQSGKFGDKQINEILATEASEFSVKNYFVDALLPKMLGKPSGFLVENSDDQKTNYLEVILAIAESLSPCVINVGDEDELKNTNKKQNYWREGFKNELANNPDFSSRLATYLAQVPEADLRKATFSGVKGTPFEFFVNLKRSLGPKKERTFGEALAFAKVDTQLNKVENSALDAVMNAYRTTSLTSMFGGKTRTLKTAVKQDANLTTEERPSIFKNS